jgi:hypothetical protein
MIYVLTQGWDYEGEAILGVYSTLERAQTAASNFMTEFSPGDLVSIYEVEQDVPVTFGDLLRNPVWQVTTTR